MIARNQLNEYCFFHNPDDMTVNKAPFSELRFHNGNHTCFVGLLFQKRTVQVNREVEMWEKMSEFSIGLARICPVLRNYLCYPMWYLTRKLTVWNRAVNSAAIWHLSLFIDKNYHSVHQLSVYIHASVSAQTVFQGLQRQGSFTHGKLKWSINLTEAHNEALVQFKINHVPGKSDWEKLISSGGTST